MGSEAGAQLGMIGLGVMGRNLAQRHGVPVAGQCPASCFGLGPSLTS